MKRVTLLAIVVVFFIAGCDRLDTRYGLREESSHSVNGVRVLDARLAECGQITSYPRLSPRAEQRDMLVHLAPQQGLPDEQACDWIEKWLKGAPRRQFVIILRDGNVSSWLCDRWAAEVRQEAAHAEGAKRTELEASAARLQARARQEDEAPPYGLSQQRECKLFRLHLLRPLPTFVNSFGPEGMMPGATPMVIPPALHPAQLTGLVTFPTPEMFTLNASVEADAGHALVKADGEAWAMSITIGESRLVVIANATPVLDGAQVDLRARRLMAAMVADLMSLKPATIAWVDSLETLADSDPEPPNLLAMLFGKPPFSYAAFHLLALMVVFVAWKAAWFGRIASRPDRTVERFSRHVEALAFYLRRDKAVNSVVSAIAKALGRPVPRATNDLGTAMITVNALHQSAHQSNSPAAQKESP